MAHSYRKSTIKISFVNEYARPKAYEIERFIREEVKIDVQDLIGIQFPILSSVVYVKLINEAVCERIIKDNKQGLKFKHSDGHVGNVVIDHVGLGLRTIRIFELPIEVPSELVIEALKPYGKVISHVAEKWTTFTTYPVLNGVRQIQIELTKHVPSYLFIDGCRAVVIYDGQPKTCSGCGKEGHVRSECMKRRIVQLPTGEATVTHTSTTLPLSYVKVIQKDDDPKNDVPPQDIIRETIESMNTNTTVLSNTSLTTAPVTTTSKGQETEAGMEFDTVTQTSDLAPESRESQPSSDTKIHTRKQKSPKHRKKRRHSQSDNGTKADSDVQSEDSELHDTRVETHPTMPQQDEDHPMQEPSTASSVGNQHADNQPSGVETLPLNNQAGESRRDTEPFQGDWADDHEDDSMTGTANATASATALGH